MWNAGGSRRCWDLHPVWVEDPVMDYKAERALLENRLKLCSDLPFSHVIYIHSSLLTELHLQISKHMTPTENFHALSLTFCMYNCWMSDALCVSAQRHGSLSMTIFPVQSIIPCVQPSYQPIEKCTILNVCSIMPEENHSFAGCHHNALGLLLMQYNSSFFFT